MFIAPLQKDHNMAILYNIPMIVHHQYIYRQDYTTDRHHVHNNNGV